MDARDERVLVVKNASKAYPIGIFRQLEKRVLADVSFELCRGQTLGITGTNGAGKTTLVKLLLAIVRPSSGSIRVFGESPDNPNTRSRIGYLPERLALPSAATPYQYLSGTCRIKHLSASNSDITRQLERTRMHAVDA